MDTFKRLAIAYLGVGFIIAVIGNWTAHNSGATSAFDVFGTMVPMTDKLGIVVDHVLMPIVAWPFQVWGMMRGG